MFEIKKEKEKQELREVTMQFQETFGDYLYFIAKQLIDIKYELKELKDIENHGV